MPKQARIPTTEQLNDLLSKVKKTKPFGLRDWTILHLSFFAGLRAKEIASLKVQDIIEDGKIKQTAYLEADQTKNTTDKKDGRKIYITHPRLQEALSEYLNSEFPKWKTEVPKRSLFVSKRKLTITADSMVHITKRAFRRSGYDYLSSHSGRRYFATKLGKEVSTVKELQEYGGWKSVQTAMLYVDTNEDEMVDRLKNSTW